MSFTNRVAAGLALIREAFQSPNYQQGVQGWAIKRDGTAEFTGLDINAGALTTTPDANDYSVIIEDGVIRWVNEFGAEVARIGVTNDVERLVLTGSSGVGIQSPITREDLTVTGSASVGSSHVAATTANLSGVSLKHIVPTLYAYPILDIDASGRAGWFYWEASYNGGGSWLEVQSARWHDSSEGQNKDAALIARDAVLANASEVQYRFRVTVDGGLGNVILRGDSTMYVEWQGL